MKNLGNIGLPDYCVTKDGRIYSLHSNRYLSQHENYGYKLVGIRQDGVSRKFRVHRLVAEAFIPNPENKPYVNHKDGDRGNNQLSNLEWCTQSENVLHANEIGLRADFKRYSQRSLSDREVHRICNLIEDGWRNKDIADSVGCKPQRIAEIRNGECYPDISCEYDFSLVNTKRIMVSPEKIDAVCKMIEEGCSYLQIRGEVGVSGSTISKIKKRLIGVYISKNYKW